MHLNITTGRYLIDVNNIANLNHNSPKYLEWNLAEEILEGFFSIKYAIFSFGKCPNN